MVARMTLGMKRLQLATVEVEPVAVVNNDDALGVDGPKLAVHLLGAPNAVDRLGALDQLLGIDHVRRTPWVQYATRVWQRLHQQARSPGVVQVDMSQENIVDVRHVEIHRAQRIQKQWYAVVGSGIDERAAPVLDDQVAGVLQRPQVLGVDGNDAAANVSDRCIDARHVRSAFLRPAHLLGARGLQPVKTGEITRQHNHVLVRKQHGLSRHDTVLPFAVAVLLQRVPQVVFMLTGQRRPGRVHADAVRAVAGGAMVGKKRCPALGIAIGEANIWSQPSRAEGDWQEYRSKFPEKSGFEWQIVPFGTGLAVTGRF